MTRPASDAKERILNAARAIFGRKGFDAARVDEIARAAGVSKAPVYYYFESKRTILNEPIQSFVSQSTRTLIGFAKASGPVEDPAAEKHMQRYCKLFEENRDLLKIMLIESIKDEAEEIPVFRLIHDSGFTQSNFGFREGRSQHQAIRTVREKVKQRYRWCASVDLKSYFDEIPHDQIFKLIRRRIDGVPPSDERLVTLIARALEAGVVVEGKFEKTTKGVPQGSLCKALHKGRRSHRS